MYIFLISIKSNVDKSKSVCMNTYISAVIGARVTEFGNNMYFLYIYQ